MDYMMVKVRIIMRIHKYNTEEIMKKVNPMDMVYLIIQMGLFIVK